MITKLYVSNIYFLKQLWIVLGIVFSCIGVSAIISFSSAILPNLRLDDSDIKVNLKEESWIASSTALSAAVGFFISPYLMDMIGRKYSSILVLIPGIIGWVILYFAPDVATIMIGRVIGGLTAGGVTILGAIVVGEYTDPKYRSAFLCLQTTSICLGNLFLHLQSAYFHWRTVSLLSLGPLILAFINIITWHESPVWLFYKKKYEKSEIVFFSLRGRSKKTEHEYTDFVKAQSAILEHKSLIKGNAILNLFKKFKEADFVKPYLIVSVGSILIAASGRHWFPAFALDIIQSLLPENTESNKFVFTIIIDIIAVLGSTASCVLLLYVSKRPMLFFSGLSSFICIISLCFYLYLISWGIITNGSYWVSLSLLITFFTLVNLGCSTIPIALLGEIFPLKHKVAGSSLSSISLNFGLFFSLYLTPYLLFYIQIEGTLAVNAIFLASSLIYMYFMLPETSKKTLQDIENFFAKSKEIS